MYEKCVCCGAETIDGQLCYNCKLLEKKKIIEVDGYKAFYGKMRIKPRMILVPPFEVKSDWLYKPETDCWYDGKSSYPASICEIVED